jgi:hypothetical protein
VSTDRAPDHEREKGSIMADPDLTLLGRRIEALQADVREIKFAADVDRQDQRAQRDVLVRQLGTSLGLFQGAVETQLTDMRQELGQMREQLDRIENVLRTSTLI